MIPKIKPIIGLFFPIIVLLKNIQSKSDNVVKAFKTP